MKTLNCLLLSLLLVGMTSCARVANARVVKGNGDIVTRTVNVGDFHGISAAQAIKVVYVQREGKPSVKAETDENVMPLLDISVSGGVLKVKYRKNTNLQNVKTLVTVCAPAVRELEASSAASIELAKGLSLDGELEIEASSAATVSSTADVRCGELSLEVSSAASVALNNVKTTMVKAEVSSAASAKLGGVCKRVDFEVSSAGNIKATGLQAEHGKAEASSGGSVSCNVLGKLSWEKNSGGSVINTCSRSSEKATGSDAGDEEFTLKY